jgi:crotonobetainyl-CoA:carnitine CoA-transferase CaiB-like acyl-CoA transferase
MRERTGEGAHVKVALFDAAVASLANQASVYLNTGVSPQRMGSLHPSIAPYGEVFRCADRQCLLIACGTDAQFSSLCQVLNHEELSHDPRFSSNPLRVANRSDLEAELARLFSMCESGHILNELIQKGVPAGKVRELSDVFDLPEVRDLILEEQRNGKVTKRVSTAVFKINPQPC